MSRPRIRQDRKRTPSSSPTKNDYSLIAVPSPSPTRRRNLTRQPALYLANGQKFIQRPRLVRPLGQLGLLERPQNPLEGTNDNHNAGPIDIEPYAEILAAPLTSAHQHKRIAQTHRWQTEVLPRLIRPYMSLLRQTSNLKYETTPSFKECTCLNVARILPVVVVRFGKLEKVELSVCPCQPAAVQLVEQGLFPCAPLHPTLAVDIRLLDFATRLFLRVAPNNTAWVDTINDFLNFQGYQLQGKDPLRRRFGNALQWYNCLQDLTGDFVDSALAVARNNEDDPGVDEAESEIVESARQEDEESDQSCEDSDRDSTASHVPKRALRMALDEKQLSRPTEYLRARCPLCFGGDFQTQRGLE
ncbi:hypothetical protein FB446DRAFT_798584 [Lentinula raphanica]|nr:hypothetical protein FB446DRAFT_798584 [Lentinula raphanica]